MPGQGVRVEPRPLTQRELPIVLTPYVLPGGLGEHKWVDRRLIDALDGTPLFLDADGTVLEAGWASVLVRRDGRLLTPRIDGRILPSTSRPDAEETDIRLRTGRRAVPQLGDIGCRAGHHPGTARRYASYSAPNWSLSVGSS